MPEQVKRRRTLPSKKMTTGGSLPPQAERTSPEGDVNSEDLRASSLKVIFWLNETLDVAASMLGDQWTHAAVLTLLILHKNEESKAMSGKKLIQLYKAWTVEERSQEMQYSLQSALGRLIGTELVQVGAIDGLRLSALKNGELQVAVGQLLEKGLESLQKIRLSSLGEQRTKAIRRMIDARLDEVRKTLPRNYRKTFKKIIDDSLPYPSVELNLKSEVSA